MDLAEQVALEEDAADQRKMERALSSAPLTLELEPAAPSRAVPVVQQGGALAEASPAGIMLAALSRGVSPGDIREMLALQREWDADQARKSFNRAFAAFKAEAIRIVKAKDVKDGPLKGKRYAELFNVVDAVSPVLSAHGLSTSWKVTRDERDWIEVTCELKHVDGHAETVSLGGPPDVGGAKNAIQARASTISYLQRYTLKAITGVAEGGEDDDGQGGATAAAAAPSAAPAAPAPQAPTTWPDDSFAKQLPRWTKAVAEGIKTPADILAWASAKGALTAQQTAQINALKPATTGAQQ
jgi:hypothetical protein